MKQLFIQDSEIVWQALRRFKVGNADFVDCLIERIAHANGCSRTVTFDKKAVRVTRMACVEVDGCA
ncbi:MAG: hypothetical protein ACUVQ6_05350 [Dissulfurimicrobium sp.]|uniref:hypothetical protein n=1 Tax=Dissulfurimicrobium sp. TaxID=2022436 RepID=UPI0040498D21